MIRGKLVYDTLCRVEALPAPRCAAILERAGQKTVSSIREARLPSWVPVELDVKLSCAICEVLGAEGCRLFFLETMTKVIESPLMRTFVNGAVGLFGLNPDKLVPWIAKSWPLIYREVGVVSSRIVGLHSSDLVWSQLPASIARFPDYLVGVEGSLQSVFILTGVTGKVSLDFSATSRTARFGLEWTPSKP